MLQINKEQQDAITFRDGTLLLIAGPGSGKTFVLTNRIKALIDSGIDSSHILVITFTKAAASEMQSRFERLMTKENAVSFGTFHSIFYSILKHHKKYSNVVPITDKEKLNIIKRTFEIVNLPDAKENLDELLSTLGLISACKNNGNQPNAFTQNKYDSATFTSIFNTYNDLLLEFNKIDFDDMINLCLGLLANEPGYLKRWQDKYSYILIDEFQDISSNQYELVKLLASPENNIFAVGDDDQSIYRFRGARVEIMHRLQEDFKDSETKYLSVNYRCESEIVTVANQVISENTLRFAKNIMANKRGGCSAVDIKGFSSPIKQNEYIIKLLQGCSNEELNGYAILTRNNRYGSKYAALLRSNNILVDYKEKTIPFSASYIKDICAYIEYAEGNHSREVFLRIMNKPLRYIKRDYIPSFVNEQKLIDAYESDSFMQKRIKLMFEQLARIHNMSIFLAINYIRKVIGYDEYIKSGLSAESYKRYTEEIEEFTSICRECKSYLEIQEKLKMIQSSEAESSLSKGVHIYTYHSSKGLEFSRVILPDVNDGIIPTKSAHTNEDIEEERRMLYVAMTRAQDNLHILYRTDENNKPSRFIGKILNDKT